MNAKLRLGLFGGDFQGDKSTTLTKAPYTAQWCVNERLPHSVWVDDYIRNGLHSPPRESVTDYAWVVEASSIRPDVKKYCIENARPISERFKYLFSHDSEIIDAINKIKRGKAWFVPSHGSLIQDIGLHEKTKLVSMVSSNKNYCEGHAHRLAWVEKLRNQVDLYGKGFNPIPIKEPALIPYMFSIVIENEKYEQYWSEKILDAFVTGTVPVYYGSDDLEFFSEEGVIRLTDDFSVDRLTPELYESMAPHIRYNFMVAQQIYTAEERLVEILESTFLSN